MPRPFAAGDRVLLVDAKRRRHLITLAEGGAVPHATPACSSTTHSSAQPTGITVRTTLGRRAWSRCGPTLAEYVLEDAARRAGDLPEGPRPDPDARRHLPRRARPRVGRRLGRAHDDAAARGRPDRVTSPATSSATTSPTRPHATSRASSAPTSRSRRGARRLRRHRGRPTSTASCSTSPSRGGSVKHAEAALRPGGILLAYLPDDRPGRRACARSSRRRRSAWSRRSRCCSARWHVDGQSVRPDHRMVAHTGFLTHARLLAADDG